MKENKIKKYLSIILTIVLCLGMMSQVLATDKFLGDSGNVEPILYGDQTNANKMASIVGNVLGAMQFGCWAIAVGMIIYLGIRYMMAAAHDRADLKMASIRYVVGALIIATASTVFALFWNVAVNVTHN